MELIRLVEQIIGPVSRHGTAKLMMDCALAIGLINYHEWQECENILTKHGGIIPS